MKLFTSLLAALGNVSVFASCPEDICWKTVDGTCAFQKNTCGATVTCNANYMEASMKPEGLGGVTGETAAVITSPSGCGGVDQNDVMGLVFTTQYAFCDVERKLNDAGDRILFELTLSRTYTDSSENVRYEGETQENTIYLADAYTMSVKFTCSFPLTAEVESGAVEVKRPVSLSGELESPGSWANAFELKFGDGRVEGSEFSSTTPTLSGLIGSTVYVEVSFKYEASHSHGGNYLWWVVDGCTVAEDDTADAKKIEIVKDTCFSKLVGAGLWSGSMGRRIYNVQRFQYNSFGFDASGAETQILRCTMRFCVSKATGPNYCDIVLAHDAVCPADTPFDFQKE